MKAENRCPHCTQPLQSFQVTSPVGTEVELRSCGPCGKVWAPSGHLQRAFGTKAQHHMVGGSTSHSCVECRILLTPSTLGSGATAEVCSACQGLFLDATELTALGIARQAPPPALPVIRPPPPPVASRREGLLEVAGEEDDDEVDEEEEVTPVPSVVVRHEPPEPGTFTCVECGQRKLLREGQALRDGLACRDCMKARARG
ncbi:zf-TFIIB domain-containing protein [Melittangium boletus]|uniref:zf-TFIIB domain-containing protein n=1 Tax=Melittangium boletus TaxID=83453 RepID=UPI003DA3D453